MTADGRPARHGRAAPGRRPTATGCPTRPGTSAGYGGRFVPEALMAALDELDAAYRHARGRPGVPGRARRGCSATTPAGPACSPRRRGSPSTPAARRCCSSARTSTTPARTRSTTCSARRCSTQRMGKTRVIAETGAGQHGVATATAAALLGLDCVVYMGEEDTRRQALNVARMRLLGAEVVPVDDRLADPQGRHQRGDARLGDQRRRHPLPARLGRRPAPVPDDGPRLPAGHRRGGARAGARR